MGSARWIVRSKLPLGLVSCTSLKTDRGAIAKEPQLVSELFACGSLSDGLERGLIERWIVKTGLRVLDRNIA